jgi:hypothetical protein
VEVERARQVAKVSRWLGWPVAAVGAVGVAVYTAFWASGDLSAEQGVSLVPGTAPATTLSGVTAYGAGVNIGLGRRAPATRRQGSGLSPLSQASRAACAGTRPMTAAAPPARTPTTPTATCSTQPR